MGAVLRAASIYLILLLLFRLAGKRTLAQITTFDFVLLLMIGEATQQGLLGNDFSVVNAVLVIVTLIGVDIGISLLKRKSRGFERVLEGHPIVILEDGEPIKERMERSRVDESDILAAARELQGLERLDQIRYAVLERSGGISIIPKQQR